MRKTAPILTFAAPLLLAACATTTDGPYRGPLAAEGTPVALEQSVAVADLVLTPIAVTEDSRCPINARCVWAGRVTVETRVDGAGWRESVPMTLGEPVTLRGYRLTLVSAEPNRMTSDPAPLPADYRLVYEGGSTGVAG